jgi:16S rRNA (cytidine1402-2'-O)-methyltransferase
MEKISKENKMSCLYIVASPIGNLSDLTERAKSILSSVDLIACEDTRVSSKIMSHLGLRKPLISCNAHNENYKSTEIIQLLSEGKQVAYLSDAGTPGLSDPGGLLVQAITEAGFKIIPVPGVSSLTTIISVCGFDLSHGFFFAGFLPRTEIRLTKILGKYLVDRKSTIIALESPHRIRKSLKVIAEFNPQLKLCIGRELTKHYEEIIRGNAAEVSEQKFNEKGEFVLVIHRLEKADKKDKYSNRFNDSYDEDLEVDLESNSSDEESA